MRKSRRVKNMSPERLDISSFEFQRSRQEEMRQLFTMGGTGGKIDARHEDWVFDEIEQSKLCGFRPIEEIDKELEAIELLEDDNKQAPILETNKESTYYLIANTQLRELETLMTCAPCTKKTVRSEREDAVASFLSMMKDDPDTHPDHLFTLWKEKEKLKQDEKTSKKLHITTANRGLATELIVQCCHCTNKHHIAPKLSRYANLDWSQQPTRRWNNAWYDINVRAVLATLAIGGGGSDISDLLSFIDVPNCASFGTNAFNKIEALIGKELRSCGMQAMDGALEEEVRLTNEEKGIDHEEWSNMAISQRPQTKLTVTYDMGWQKRSSGNRYDSLSGYAL